MLLQNGANLDERRRLCLELQKVYGLTELEATNVLNGRNVMDYVYKYERIRTLTPIQLKKNRNKNGEVEENDDGRSMKGV